MSPRPPDLQLLFSFLITYGPPCSKDVQTFSLHKEQMFTTSKHT